jgi:hypothetical protein
MLDQIKDSCQWSLSVRRQQMNLVGTSVQVSFGVSMFHDDALVRVFCFQPDHVLKKTFSVFLQFNFVQFSKLRNILQLGSQTELSNGGVRRE